MTGADLGRRYKKAHARFATKALRAPRRPVLSRWPNAPSDLRSTAPASSHAQTVAAPATLPRALRLRATELTEAHAPRDSNKFHCATPATSAQTPKTIPGLQWGTSLFRGGFPMDSILPERLLALVRPAFDLVLRSSKSKTLRAGVWQICLQNAQQLRFCKAS